MEGDERILMDMLVEWNMDGCSEVTTPYVKAEAANTETPIKDPKRVAKYRRGAAKLNYLSLDDPRISYASKQISQTMASPTEEGEMHIKRVLRYLRGKSLCMWAYPWQDAPGYLIGNSDSDWAGCARSRRSTSGGGDKIWRSCGGSLEQDTGMCGIELGRGRAQCHAKGGL